MSDHACTFDHACESCFVEWQSIENVLVEFGEVEAGMAGAGEWPLRSGVLEVRVTLDDGRVLTVSEPDGPFTFRDHGHIIERPSAVAVAVYDSFDALVTSSGPAGFAEAHGSLLHDFLHGLTNLMKIVAAA